MSTKGSNQPSKKFYLDDIGKSKSDASGKQQAQETAQDKENVREVEEKNGAFKSRKPVLIDSSLRDDKGKDKPPVLKSFEGGGKKNAQKESGEQNGTSKKEVKKIQASTKPLGSPVDGEKSEVKETMEESIETPKEHMNSSAPNQANGKTTENGEMATEKSDLKRPTQPFTEKSKTFNKDFDESTESGDSTEKSNEKTTYVKTKGSAKKSFSKSKDLQQESGDVKPFFQESDTTVKGDKIEEPFNKNSPDNDKGEENSDTSKERPNNLEIFSTDIENSLKSGDMNDRKMPRDSSEAKAMSGIIPEEHEEEKDKSPKEETRSDEEGISPRDKSPSKDVEAEPEDAETTPNEEGGGKKDEDDNDTQCSGCVELPINKIQPEEPEEEKSLLRKMKESFMSEQERKAEKYYRNIDKANKEIRRECKATSDAEKFAKKAEKYLEKSREKLREKEEAHQSAEDYQEKAIVEAERAFEYSEMDLAHKAKEIEQTASKFPIKPKGT